MVSFCFFMFSLQLSGIFFGIGLEACHFQNSGVFNLLVKLSSRPEEKEKLSPKCKITKQPIFSNFLFCAQVGTEGGGAREEGSGWGYLTKIMRL